MLKRILILIIVVLVTSATSASDSAIIKKKAHVNEVAAVEIPSNSAGIKDVLADKNLKQILADVLKIKKGKLGKSAVSF